MASTYVIASNEAASDIGLDLSGSFLYDGTSYKIDQKWSFTLVNGDSDHKDREVALFSFQGRSDDAAKVPISFMALGTVYQSEFESIDMVAGNDYFDHVEIKKLPLDKTLILFWSQGGAHYTNLDVYQIESAGLKKIFKAGSACGVEVSDGDGVIRIKVYRDKLDVPGWSFADETDRWELWCWNGSKFIHDPRLSTSNSQSRT